MATDSRRRVLLAVHAHPDDECIGTGGVLARYSAQGARTVLVTCTGGEVGEISDPALASPENLGEVRARELAEAARLLGISRVAQLGYRDSGMAGTPDNEHPQSFNKADLDEAVGRVVRVIREERPQVVVTYDENGGYGHPDHIMAHRVAVGAFHAAGDLARYPEAGPPWQPAKLYYVVFPRRRFERAFEEAGLEWPWRRERAEQAAEERLPEGAVPDDPEASATAAVDVSAFVEVKLAALRAHRTQVGPDSFFLKLPPELMRRVWSHEFFRLVGGTPGAPPGQQESDLFAGLD